MSLRSAFLSSIVGIGFTFLTASALAQTEGPKPQIRSLAEFKKMSRADRELAWDIPEPFGLIRENTYLITEIIGEDARALFARKDAKLRIDPRLEVDAEELYFNEDQPRAFIGAPRAFSVESVRVASTRELIGITIHYEQAGCEGEPGLFEETRYASSAIAAAAGCLETDVQWQWHGTYYGDGRVVHEEERMEWSGY